MDELIIFMFLVVIPIAVCWIYSDHFPPGNWRR
jgi:hypothetical protein